MATTSRYLHARPGDSSARFLALERFQSREIDLQVSRAGVMNVLIAGIPAKGERTEMSTKIAKRTNRWLAPERSRKRPRRPTL